MSRITPRSVWLPQGVMSTLSNCSCPMAQKSTLGESLLTIIYVKPIAKQNCLKESILLSHVQLCYYL